MRVSIPYSSGPPFSQKNEAHTGTVEVSIPYSLGLKFSQSRGKNQGVGGGDVSIPYSLGLLYFPKDVGYAIGTAKA